MEIRDMSTPDYPLARQKMVREQVIARGIKDPRIIETMLALPRHLFLDGGLGPQAYSDYPFPIGFSQTMTQPFMVALLASSLELRGGERVLEIGTGSGYQAAVLSRLAREVFSIERIPELSRKASKALSTLGIENVSIRTGDGSLGWKEKAPFERILITAATSSIPTTLVAQLVEGGIMVSPVDVGPGRQELVRWEKCGGKLRPTRLRECSFVPLVRGVFGEEGP